MFKNIVFSVFLGSIIIIPACKQVGQSGPLSLPDRQPLSSVWNPDNGDGTYTNPVIYADYSDPDICRAGDDYYLVASSFNCIPGLPLLHSRDLVNWSLVGYAIDRLEPADVFDKPQHGNGIFAPSIRYHHGEYYIYYGDPDFGIFMLKATDPLGKWSDPLLVKAGKGMIDPCPFWDDDGRVYLVYAYAASRSGLKSILVVNELNTEGTRVIGEEVMVFDGHKDHPIIEGPKFYKRDGYYYIFAPGGGVKQGWQTILRSQHVYGPYEDKIVLAQGNTVINGPHQGAWVDDREGNDWFLHFQDMEAYGRVIHLQPVTWKDGWPVMGSDPDGDGTGEPVLSYRKPAGENILNTALAADSDEFNGQSLALQWQWHANPKHTWAMHSGNNGFLRLNCIPVPEDFRNMWDIPNLLLQKIAAPEFIATTRFTFNSYPVTDASDKAGLIVMGRDYAYLSIEKQDSQWAISQVECTDAMRGGLEVVNARLPATTNELFFRVTVSEGAQCNFSYSFDGIHYLALGRQFSAVPGRWIGAKVGLFATRSGISSDNGSADFDWFRIEKPK
jgi:beta-xylosidase